MEYTSILDNTQPIHVIPAYASVEEHALFTIASAEESYNRIMESVGIYELSLVMEGNENKEKLSIKNVLKKFTDFVKGLWQRFQDLVKTATDKFKSFVANKVKTITDKKVDKNKVVEAIKASKADRWKAEAIAKEVFVNDKAADFFLDKTKDALETIANKVETAVKNNTVDEIDANEIFAEKLNMSSEAFGDSLKVKEAVKQRVFMIDDKAKSAEEVKEYAATKFVTYYDRLTKASGTFTNGLKKSYNETKKNFNTTIKDAQKIAKESENSKAFKPLFRSASATLKTSSCIVSAIESAYYAEFSYLFRVVLTGIAVSIAYKEKKVKESAEVKTESSVYQSELSTLFNF